MTTGVLYENFPARIVLLSSTVAFAIYALGTYILARLAIPLALLYLLYAVWLEATVLRSSCVHCYYYGKLCGLGKGRLCARLLPAGDPQRFTQREVSWRELVPDMMVLIFPLLGGIVLLVRTFSWLILVLLVVLVVLSLGGNAVVRGSFACKHCRQRELGCPAHQVFDGSKT